MRLRVAVIHAGRVVVLVMRAMMPVVRTMRAMVTIIPIVTMIPGFMQDRAIGRSGRERHWRRDLRGRMGRAGADDTGKSESDDSSEHDLIPHKIHLFPQPERLTGNGKIALHRQDDRAAVMTTLWQC